MRQILWLAAIFLVGGLPFTASAQAPPPSGGNTPPTPGNLIAVPNDFPTPTQPWYGLPFPGRGNYGDLVQYITVPPQQVIINAYVPGPGSFSGTYEPQVVEIPGYYVGEMTRGYYYPERWGLQEVTLGVYQWVRLPPTFQPK